MEDCVCNGEPRPALIKNRFFLAPWAFVTFTTGQCWNKWEDHSLCAIPVQNALTSPQRLCVGPETWSQFHWDDSNFAWFKPETDHKGIKKRTISLSTPKSNGEPRDWFNLNDAFCCRSAICWLCTFAIWEACVFLPKNGRLRLQWRAQSRFKNRFSLRQIWHCYFHHGPMLNQVRGPFIASVLYRCRMLWRHHRDCALDQKHDLNFIETIPILHGKSRSNQKRITKALRKELFLYQRPNQMASPVIGSN